MVDRLTSMGVFVKATDAGSFAAAAAALGISPQMASKHVLGLEKRLGARLLNRTTRSQSLTEAGRLFYERCKHVLAEAEAADAVVRELGAAPKGRLRVTAPTTLGASRLVTEIARYLHRFPEVEVELMLTDRSVDLIEEGQEVALRIGPLSDSTLTSRALTPYRLIACASPRYLAACGSPQAPQDLRAHACLGYVFWAKPPGTAWGFTRAGDRQTVEVRGRLQVNDGRALLAAAKGDLGIVLGPEMILSDEIAAGNLVRVLPEYDGPSRPMHLLYVADRRPTPKLRSFLDWMIAAFGD